MIGMRDDIRLTREAGESISLGREPQDQRRYQAKAREAGDSSSNITFIEIDFVAFKNSINSSRNDVRL
jgi:hypothetical protein